MASLISTCPRCTHWEPVLTRYPSSNTSPRYRTGGFCSTITKALELDVFEPITEAWTSPTFGCIYFERNHNAPPQE